MMLLNPTSIRKFLHSLKVGDKVCVYDDGKIARGKLGIVKKVDDGSTLHISYKCSYSNKHRLDYFDMFCGKGYNNLGKSVNEWCLGSWPQIDSECESRNFDVPFHMTDDVDFEIQTWNGRNFDSEYYDCFEFSLIKPHFSWFDSFDAYEADMAREALYYVRFKRGFTEKSFKTLKKMCRELYRKIDVEVTFAKSDFGVSVNFKALE